MRSAVRGLFGSSSAVLLAVGLFSACGGEDRGRLKPAVSSAPADAGGDQCAAADGLTLQNITSFDPPLGATRTLTALCDPTINPAKRPCMYYNSDVGQSPRQCGTGLKSPATCRQADGSPIADSVCLTTSIPAMISSVPVAPIPGGRCGVSNYGFHLVGTNIATCYDPTTLREGWGSTLQITFNPSATNSGQSEIALDASQWDGVSLWVRRGSTSGGASLLASIQDPYSASTDSLTGFTHPPACQDGGVSADGGTDCFIACEALASLEPFDPKNPPPPDARKCDPFGFGILLTPDWRFIKLPFASARQKGFGVPSPLGKLDTSALLGLQLGVSAGDLDVWIDDIAFYREP